MQLLGAQSPEQREELAQAYERGDGFTVGRLMGEQFANLPIFGGLGSIGKLGKVADAASLGKLPKSAGTPNVPGATRVPDSTHVEGPAKSAGANGGTSAGRNAGFDTTNLQSKLERYLLDPAHPQNQTKANWFQQALGFDKSNWQQLGSQITFNETTAIATKTTQYGQTFEQVIQITGANGKTIDVPFIFMKDNTGTVRLVTGIPAKK